MSKSIDAYSDEERVERYDTDMDLMHPNRHKMVDVALDVLPFQPTDRLLALDLGAGTGYFTTRFLKSFPNSRVVAVDGSDAMVNLAMSRLKDAAGQVRFVTTSFEDLTGEHVGDEKLHIVFSSYALHHLDAATKRTVLETIARHLEPGGWFVNADLVSSPFPDIEGIIQSIRARGIAERNAGRDPRFKDVARVREFLDGLEETEGDQPLPIAEDLSIMRTAGLANATVFWQEYREVVLGGCVAS